MKDKNTDKKLSVRKNDGDVKMINNKKTAPFSGTRKADPRIITIMAKIADIPIFNGVTLVGKNHQNNLEDTNR